jgi:hypothetical protein
MTYLQVYGPYFVSGSSVPHSVYLIPLSLIVVIILGMEQTLKSSGPPILTYRQPILLLCVLVPGASTNQNSSASVVTRCGLYSITGWSMNILIRRTTRFALRSQCCQFFLLARVKLLEPETGCYAPSSVQP